MIDIQDEAGRKYHAQDLLSNGDIVSLLFSTFPLFHPFFHDSNNSLFLGHFVLSPPLIFLAFLTFPTSCHLFPLLCPYSYFISFEFFPSFFQILTPLPRFHFFFFCLHRDFRPIGVILSYSLASLGFTFIVQPELFLVHLPHPPSESWRATFGSTASSGTQLSTRFDAILDIYAKAKGEIDVQPPKSTYSKGFGIGMDSPGHRYEMGPWSVEGESKIRALRRGMGVGTLSGSRRRGLPSNMYELWHDYKPKALRVVER